jgi:hypothetical protein
VLKLPWQIVAADAVEGFEGFEGLGQTETLKVMKRAKLKRRASHSHVHGLNGFGLSSVFTFKFYLFLNEIGS